MNFLNTTHNRLLMLLMIGLSVLAACDQGVGRGVAVVTSDSASSAPEHSLSTASTTQTIQSLQGSRILSSYSGSYALLIGESQYTHGWSNLESIPGELQKVEQVLKSQGFTVEKSSNLNSRPLKDRFERFIDKYGFDKNNRLLFFYSGHGHTREDKGYIVPVDATEPNLDEKAFLRKAVGMNQILTWARRIEAKHVLFLFDSCFSGTVFKARNLPNMPRQISQSAKEPVRQFITAGSANEVVPAKSVFTPAFIDALRYGWGDLYKDGYVTGEELGLYLKNKVRLHSAQTPQYGKIKDYELSRGDFVFVVGSKRKVQFKVPAPKPVLKQVPIVKPNSDGDNYDVITKSDIEPVFNEFIAAWNQKQHRRLMSLLWSDFHSIDRKGDSDYHQFSANKKKFFSEHSWLSVTTSNIKYHFYGNEGIVTYYQHYNSSSYKSKGTRKLYFRKDGGQTKIFRDEFERDWYKIMSQSESDDIITKSDIEPVFNGFIAAWNQKQHRRLMSLLWSDFHSVDHKGDSDYHQFSANKKNFFSKHSWLLITTSNIKYHFDGNEGTVTYYQHYNSSSYQSKGIRKLYFRKDGGQTKIFRDEFERDWYTTK